MATILSKEDKNICEQISSGDDSIHKKRAKALLLIDEGQVHSDVAGETGLSLGQVRYALARFKVLGTSLFPSELIIEKEMDIIEPVTIMEETIETVETPLNDQEEVKVSEKPKKEKDKKKKNKKEESSKKSKNKKEKSKKKDDSKKKSKKEKKKDKKK